MSERFPVDVLCSTLQLSRSGYYAWRASSGGKRQARDERLLGSIREIFEASRRTYGYPRVTRELREQGSASAAKTSASDPARPKVTMTSRSRPIA